MQSDVRHAYLPYSEDATKLAEAVRTMRARDVLPDRDVLAAYESMYGELAANRCKWCKTWFMQTESGRRIKEDYHTFCSSYCRARYESKQDAARRRKRKARLRGEGLK